MKKFYKLVSTHKEGGLYQVHLDGRPVKCPSGKALSHPSEKLVQALMGEWAAQGETIDPETMPLTQILTTQIDRVSRERKAMETALFKYLDTDLLCYRAGDDPPGQREAQETAWNPWLGWFEKRFGETLQTTNDLRALTQLQTAHDTVHIHIQNLQDGVFTILGIITPLSGSLVLGLAFIEGAITPDQVYECAHVEEDFKGKIYNEELYGRAPLEEKKDAAMRRDLEATALFLMLTESKER